MPKVNVIDCKTKGSIMAYLFAPLMVSKSTTAGNIIVFKDFVIN